MNYAGTKVSIGLLVLSLAIIACNNSIKENKNNQTTQAVNDSITIKKGEHLVAIMGCNDCHSPKAMGPHGPEIIADKMLSGYPSEMPIVKHKNKLIEQGFAMFYPDLTASIGPWGISFAGNLTPDATGIGNWSEEQFKKALTQGKYKGMDGGRMLLPPMPWPNYQALNDNEIHAIFMYLRSIKPVRNIVPSPVSPDKI